MTQPKSWGNRRIFEYDEFVLDVNRDFMESSDAIAVPIRYNLPDEELYALLD